MRRAAIDDQNRILIRRQQELRLAADIVAKAWEAFPEVWAIAVIGSVAGPLWKQVPRFREFRRGRIDAWHECGDLDLALWITSQHRLSDLRRAADRALSRSFEAGAAMSVVGHQVDVFLFEPGTNDYLGRLCYCNQCPKGKFDCLVPGCGETPFNKRIEGFTPNAGLLAPAPQTMLFRRDAGRLRSALDLPAPGSGPQAPATPG